MTTTCPCGMSMLQINFGTNADFITGYVTLSFGSLYSFGSYIYQWSIYMFATSCTWVDMGLERSTCSLNISLRSKLSFRVLNQKNTGIQDINTRSATVLLIWDPPQGEADHHLWDKLTGYLNLLSIQWIQEFIRDGIGKLSSICIKVYVVISMMLPYNQL